MAKKDLRFTVENPGDGQSVKVTVLSFSGPISNKFMDGFNGFPLLRTERDYKAVAFWLPLEKAQEFRAILDKLGVKRA